MKKVFIGLIGAITLGAGYQALKPHVPFVVLLILAISYAFAIRWASNKWGE